MKSKISPGFVIVAIVVGACCLIAFVLQYVGYKNYNEISHQSNDADTIARAFSVYPKSHGGRYPSFLSSVDAFSQLRPVLEQDASRVSDEGHHYTTIERLESMAKNAVWNTALSEKIANAEYDAPVIWTFYLPAVLSKERYVVGYTNGNYKTMDKSEMSELFRNPGKN